MAEFPKSGRFEDLTGRKFGKLTVLSFVKTHNSHSYWLVQCSCSNTQEVQASNLKSGSKISCTSCGLKRSGKKSSIINLGFHGKKPALDLTGNVYGLVTVIKLGEPKVYANGKNRTWTVLCACGKQYDVQQQALTGEKTKRCRDCYLK